MEQNKKDGDPGCDIGNRTPNAPFPPPPAPPRYKERFFLFPSFHHTNKRKYVFPTKMGWAGSLAA